MDREVYVGVRRRVLFRSTNCDFYQPTSATDDFSIASRISALSESFDEHGLVLQLANEYKEGSIKNDTRYFFCGCISLHSREREYLYYGYSNTILIKSIHLWTRYLNSNEKSKPKKRRHGDH